MDKKNGNHPPTLEKLTGTRDKNAQAQAFLQVLNRPVIDLVVRLDTRSNAFSVITIGATLSAEDTVKILARGIEAVHSAQIEQIRMAQGEMIHPAETDPIKGGIEKQPEFQAPDPRPVNPPMG